MVKYAPFYKVIIIKIGVFSSCIIDEKHFLNDIDAKQYVKSMNDNGYVAVAILM